MPGTTPVYGFPYPEPTDLVADYPALGQQLAEDIEAVLPIASLHTASLATAQSGTATNATFFDITNLSITLTPLSTSSTFLAYVVVTGSTNDGTFYPSMRLRLVRDSTTLQTSQMLLTGSNSGSNTVMSLTHLDSPATTSPITYKVQAGQNITGSSLTIYLNRSAAAATVIGESRLTILEIP